MASSLPSRRAVPASPSLHFRHSLAIASLFLAMAGAARAGVTYQSPSQSLADIVDAPAPPAVFFSPGHEWMLLLERPGFPPIDELAEPELRLAGVRIRPRTGGGSRETWSTGIVLKRLPDGTEKHIQGLPADARITQVKWSPDGQRIAFAVESGDAITLWTAEANGADARRLFDGKLNAVFGSSWSWFSDSRTIICLTISSDRGEEPAGEAAPEGPVVQETNEKAAPSVTWQDLLSNARDEALFEHYFTSQGMIVSLDGKVRPVGPRGILYPIEPSPDGRYLLVEELHRPWSYLVPHFRFPNKVAVFAADGTKVRDLFDIPLKESVPSTFGSVPTGPRNVTWREDVPATLVWVEARDEGDARVDAEIRDELFTLAAPFDGKPASLIRLGYRHGGTTWSGDDLALVNEFWWKTRRSRTWIVQPGRSGAEPKILWDRSSEDRYGNPGTPITQPDARGRDVLLTRNDGREIYLVGQGASEEGNRPFLDRLNLDTKETTRLWRSEAPYYELPLDVLDDDAKSFLTRRESVEEPPNYFIRDTASGQLTALTAIPHPTPFLKGIRKELIHYSREDGVKLTGTLYLPPGYKDGDGPLPVLLWAYPQEFKSADAAGQVNRSPYTFDRVHPLGALVWLSRGYAVLDNPTMPIVGEGDLEPNDTYVQQLVSGAKAAVNELVRRGIAEPGRIAIGGHSYGAFMAANLLAHSDLFSAAIARSGAYNRTLTPFGFQSEERNFWEAPQIYSTMSPFVHADRINEPILLIHGEVDNNPGTYPMQSERLFEALKGLGKTTSRLVMLPHESHSYRARESLLHMLWESEQWLDRYVRNGSVAKAAPLN